MTNANVRRHLLLPILLCVIIRLVFLFYWPENYGLHPVDVDGYWEIGRNLQAGKGFAVGPEPSLTANRAPMYPAVLAGAYWLVGGQERMALAWQAALDATTCVGIYLLAMAVTGSFAIAYLACLLWAVYLPEVSQITRFWSEPLAALFLTYALLLYIHAWKRDELWRYGLAGLMFAGVALTRPVFLLLPLLFAALLLIKRGSVLKRRACYAGLLLLGFTLAMAPWAIRNMLVFHAFVPVMTESGINFFGGNSLLDEDSYLTRRNLSYTIPKLRSRVGESAWLQAQNSPAELDRLARREAWRLIGEHPVRFVKLSIVRFFRLWFDIGYGRTPTWRSWGVAASNLGLVVLAIIGLRTARRTWLWYAMPIMLTLVYGTLVHLPINGFGRYVFPMIPALVVLSAGGVMALWTKPSASLST